MGRTELERPGVVEEAAAGSVPAEEHEGAGLPMEGESWGKAASGGGCRGKLEPVRSVPGPGTFRGTGVPEDDLAHVGIPRRWNRISGGWMGRGGGLRPVGSIPGPGVAEIDEGKVVAAAEQNGLAGVCVEGHGRVTAPRRAVGRRGLRPVGAVPHPGVVEEIVAAVLAAEEHHAMADWVINRCGAGSARRAGGWILLRPVGPVPDPGVAEPRSNAGGGIRGEASEQHHLMVIGIIGHGRPAPWGWAVGGRGLGPVGAVPDPCVVGVAGESGPAKKKDLAVGGVVDHSCC